MTPDPDQFTLYHGTAHDFNPGDLIEPRSKDYPHSVAWASRDPEIAEAYATMAKGEQPALFNNVYEVGPASPAGPDFDEIGGVGYSDGLAVKRLYKMVPSGEALPPGKW